MPSLIQASRMPWRRTENPAGGRSTSSIAATIAYGFATSQPVTTRNLRRPHPPLGLAQLLRSAQVAAIQGRSPECRTRVNRALIASPADGNPALPAHVAWIFGLLELGFGRVEAAIRQFEHCGELVAKSSGDRADVPAFEPDLVEALIAIGRVHDARLVADLVKLRAGSSRAPATLAAAARCQAMLAPADRVQREFEAALKLCKRLDGGFERARIELCYGERLRREHRRREARRHLVDALLRFEQLGAAPWAERAQQELLATCPTHRSRKDYAGSDQLTPQERRVVQIIAGGATVRQAATQLFLSRKTIEAHLGRAYRKLNVRNRAQLVAAVTQYEASAA